MGADIGAVAEDMTSEASKGERPVRPSIWLRLSEVEGPAPESVKGISGIFGREAVCGMCSLQQSRKH